MLLRVSDIRFAKELSDYKGEDLINVINNNIKVNQNADNSKFAKKNSIKRVIVNEKKLFGN